MTQRPYKIVRSKKTGIFIDGKTGRVRVEDYDYARGVWLTVSYFKQAGKWRTMIHETDMYGETTATSFEDFERAERRMIAIRRAINKAHLNRRVNDNGNT